MFRRPSKAVGGVLSNNERLHPSFIIYLLIPSVAPKEGNMDEVVPVECLCRIPSVSSPIAASSHITAAMS